MKFLAANVFNTTTQISIPAIGGGGTSTLANLFDRNKDTLYISDAAGTDASTATLQITFSPTQTVSEISVKNINLRQYSITTYNGGVAGGNINVSANTAINRYAVISTIPVTTITVIMNTTITANQQKQIGELIISNLLYDFASDRLPSAGEYKSSIQKRQIVHEMSDGGVSVYNVREKFSAQISLSFVPTSTESSLRSVYSQSSAFIFVPFDTTTGWDGNLAEVAWIGPYEFYEFSDNNLGNGYQGQIELRQTVGGKW
mgnify:FL=1